MWLDLRHSYIVRSCGHLEKVQRGSLISVVYDQVGGVDEPFNDPSQGGRYMDRRNRKLDCSSREKDTRETKGASQIVKT